MPPRRGHRGGFRGRGFGGPSTILYAEPFEETVIIDTPADLDAWFVPPPEVVVPKSPGAGMTYYEFPSDPRWKANRFSGDAGDILPTRPQSVRTALDQENANWMSLNDAVYAALNAGKISTDFSFPFTNDFFAWKTFYTVTMQSTPFGYEPMAQLDEWRKKRAVWAQQLQTKIGNVLPGNLDTAPPRQAPDGKLPGWDDAMTKMMVPAVVIFGAVWYFMLKKR